MFTDQPTDPQHSDTDATPSESQSKTGFVKVWLESGLVRQHFVGNQTGETVQDTIRQTEPIVAELQAKHEPVLILSDFTDVGETDEESRNGLKNILGTRYFDRIAIFGVPSTLRIVGELMLNMTGKKDRVQIFDSRETAEAWLREFNRS